MVLHLYDIFVYFVTKMYLKYNVKKIEFYVILS